MQRLKCADLERQLKEMQTNIQKSSIEVDHELSKDIVTIFGQSGDELQPLGHCSHIWWSITQQKILSDTQGPWWQFRQRCMSSHRQCICSTQIHLFLRWCSSPGKNYQKLPVSFRIWLMYQVHVEWWEVHSLAAYCSVILWRYRQWTEGVTKVNSRAHQTQLIFCDEGQLSSSGPECNCFSWFEEIRFSWKFWNCQVVCNSWIFLWLS